MNAERPQLVCLTPVKNEAWILDRFLSAASTWADLIVVADQRSTDGSREIIAGHSKAVLVDNDLETFDDGANRKQLLEAARDLAPGPRILISLDADEALTADALDQPEWNTLLEAEPGTVIRMQWVNVVPDEPRAWVPPDPIVFGFVDDGSPYVGPRIHPIRLPTPDHAPMLDLRDVKVLHLQYTNMERMRSKQRWYQAWERVELPHRRPIQIYRRYHHMDAIPIEDRHPLRPAWLQGYVEHGIDLLASAAEPAYPWDGKVIDYIDEYGNGRFRRIDIWSVDWPGKANALGRSLPQGLKENPQSRLDLWIFTWLARTRFKAERRRVRWIQRALRLFGW